EALLRKVPDEIGTYFEPFIGGGALFFRLEPERAVLSDVNRRLIRTYTAVRDSVEQVIEGLEDHAARHCTKFYYDVRAQEIDHRSDVDVAVWMIYLNKTAFTGLYRVNRRNRFNVPMGSYNNPGICPEATLRRAAVALANAELVVADFETISRRITVDDFVYFDPPYVPLSDSSNFTTYSAGGFDLDDQRRLRDVAVELKNRGASVLLSNSWTPEVRELYQDEFTVGRVGASRAINSRKDKRGKVWEALIHH